MFDILVLPILTNGSDVWGTSKSGLDALDKVFLHYVRCNLGVKATICNIIVCGDYGKYPWSIFVKPMYCATKVPTSTTGYAERKNVHFVHALHRQGFSTWVTNAYDLAGTYNIDTDEGPTL